VISLAVELGIGQYHPDAGLLGSRPDDGWQIGTVIPGPSSRRLRQNELLIQIGHDHSLQPGLPREWFLPMMMQSPHEKCTDCSLCHAGCVDGYAVLPPTFLARPAQPAHRLADRSIDEWIVQMLQELIQGCEIGHADQSQRLTQFALFTEPHLGFAKGPILVAHQAQDRQQLGLPELVFAETAAVTREHRPADLQRDASKRQEPNSGHRTSCLDSKQLFQTTRYLEF
jgi:hypothetical protein